MNSRNNKGRQLIKILIVVFALLIVCANILLIRKGDQKPEMPDEEIWIKPNEPKITIELKESPAELSAGEQKQLEVILSPNETEFELVWSSSDHNVITVEDGLITARSGGRAVITVYDKISNISCRTDIEVKNDYYEKTRAAMKNLAISYTDLKASEAVRNQQKLLERCTDPQAKELYETVAEFISFAEGGEQCDFEKTAEALDMTAKEIKFAAQCMNLQNQMDDNSVTMTFTGDCTFGYMNGNNASNRFPAVYRASGSVTYPFDKVKHIFETDDITVINYEATLAEKGSKEADKKYHFRGEPDYVNILTGASVEVANLANNHSMDYGQKGFDHTVKLLNDAGVSTLSKDTPVITEINGIEVVLIGAGHWKYPTEIKDVVKAMNKQVEQYKRDDNIVVVNLHWGGEYVTTPSKAQRNAAHALIDKGADMIVSHHAHIIQGAEIYKGKVIAYGLGNFAFGGRTTLQEKETFILRASFCKDEDGKAKMKQWSIIPCNCSSTGTLKNNFQPMPVFGKSAKSMVSVLLKRSKAISGCKEFPYFYYE